MFGRPGKKNRQATGISSQIFTGILFSLLQQIHGENPATYLEDPGLGNTAPGRKMFLKRMLHGGGGFGPVEPETRVVQKRIFYDNKGRDYNPDTYIPEKTGSEMLQTRRMYGRPLPVEASDDSRKLEELLALRDRARAVHEKINDSIERFREGTRMAAMREPDDKEMRQLEHILPDMG